MSCTGLNFFQRVDIKSEYHQIQVQEEDTIKAAFCTHEGQYEFLVMPYWVTIALTTFQSLMNKIYKPYLLRLILVIFLMIFMFIT